MESAITDEFYNPKTGLFNARTIFRRLKEKDPTITFKEVKDKLKNQSVQQIFQEFRERKKDFTTF